MILDPLHSDNLLMVMSVVGIVNSKVHSLNIKISFLIQNHFNEKRNRFRFKIFYMVQQELLYIWHMYMYVLLIFVQKYSTVIKTRGHILNDSFTYSVH